MPSLSVYSRVVKLLIGWGEIASWKTIGEVLLGLVFHGWTLIYPAGLPVDNNHH